MNVVPFDFEGQAVRVIDRDGEPWFVLTDVCRVLSIVNVSHAASRLDDDEKHTLANNEGIADARVQALAIVNESGLYSLILTSRKPAARRFKKWITAEVLPTLRRTGHYAMAGGDEVQVVPVFAVPDRELTPREVNAWTNYLHTVKVIFGPRVAQGAYQNTPLPALPVPVSGAVVPDLGGVTCLAHLIEARVSHTGLLVGSLIRKARGDGNTRRALSRIGILVQPDNWKGWVAIAKIHPQLQWIFSDTRWAQGWDRALMSLPRARPGEGHVQFADRKRTAILVPMDVIEGVIAERLRNVA
jgi:prophage antirepressor-like protein